MTPTNAAIDPRFEISRIDRRIFGGFVEHLGRHIYDGIHEPGHPSADADGFRSDVVELVRELGVSTIRYPGGNFVSGYRWEDGVGPREERPRRLDLAWHSTETNEVGLHEFARWLELVGSDLMLAVNLGTRGTQEAIDLLEYVNADADTAWTRQRVANGRRDPFGVRMWCLGNEMDGPWQLGHRNADDYGKLASRTAKAMRMLDPDVELVVCGSSGSGMPTFGSWERTVLEHTFDDVDFISCHSYYQERFGDAQEFLASGVDMSRFIESVVAIADAVAATKKSDKRIMISFDEWNVWYLHNDEGGQDDKPREPGWPVAPRLLEDQYHALDAVVFGDLLITLLQHSDRVRSASLAQLVNVIAPVMTEPGGPAWRQTTFYPFSLTSRLAGERAVSVPVTSGSFESERFGTVSNVNAVATVDEGGTSLFVVNRSTVDAEDLRIDVSALGAARDAAVSIVESHLLHDDDRYAANTLDDPDRVGVVPVPGIAVEDGILSLSLPPISWAAIRLG
ncbi:alpha-L-arabinofuranosidase [Microbacterium sp. AISO3]|jgi:alpha-L-arabinofuranosidase|uniref:non-reducing end alpha-L-arabinofuranosidase n=1 Tax=Microbacterium paludicola TaxID=300019 RepID=A0ABU1I4A4_9MICO|nr:MULTISPECIES: alpha-N-arabinofuranosidase [Microbacterium]APF34133.1 alpha-L-arabinofuranosidase [Microbacterium paludicola]MDR6168555.1 alpha-N-arabinofuranosidase [Microbacterium paludicola]OWP21786.1 alpha-L-arabinofuranosidase [Microbacterium sp. AISO3]POX67853.1 alpha-L-arabinofuranosidase [Microbacterium sp. Ru50]GAD33942.1 alpha-L-arabinofuranosidase [Microbacterium sp. TS-1]